MGCNASQAVAPEERLRNEEEYKRSKEIDFQNAKDGEADLKVCKLLLLGAGESGKSTLFKQILSIYGEGISPKQLEQSLPAIHQLTVASMKQLAIQCELLVQSGFQQARLSSLEAEESRSFMASQPDDIALLDMEKAGHISRLWNDPGIRYTYSQRSKFQLVDTAEYFFDRVEQIVKESYVPSYQDVLRCRVRTTGIVENRFEISGHKFLLVDVGGQRNERKKWIHCFESVTAVIFVTSLSEYDQSLFEDNYTSRMMESLSLFDEVLHMKWFINSPVILFLNKRDLFEDKIKIVPMKNYFPNYDGGAELDKGIQFILGKFLEKVEGRRKTMVYPHVTCAMDTDNVQHVFDDVKEILIRKALSGSGLDSI